MNLSTYFRRQNPRCNELGHEDQGIIGVCVHPQSQANPALCGMCLMATHKNHSDSCIDLKDITASASKLEADLVCNLRQQLEHYVENLKQSQQVIQTLNNEIATTFAVQDASLTTLNPLGLIIKREKTFRLNLKLTQEVASKINISLSSLSLMIKKIATFMSTIFRENCKTLLESKQLKKAHQLYQAR